MQAYGHKHVLVQISVVNNIMLILHRINQTKWLDKRCLFPWFLQYLRTRQNKPELNLESSSIASWSTNKASPKHFTSRISNRKSIILRQQSLQTWHLKQHPVVVTCRTPGMCYLATTRARNTCRRSIILERPSILQRYPRQRSIWRHIHLVR